MQGHNSTDKQLLGLVERIETLEDEKADIGLSVRAVYAEGKALGYDTKIMRQVIRLRKIAPDARREMEAMIEQYKLALGLDLV